MQSRLGSLVEVLVSVVVGFAINMTANALLFPLFGWQISIAQNLLLGVFYTAISVGRGYLVRRFFNRFGRVLALWVVRRCALVGLIFTMRRAINDADRI